MTFRDYNITKVEDDNGIEKELECNERYYIPSEITWLLKSLGFTKIEISGAKLGAFSREDKITTDDFEMLVIAERQPDEINRSEQSVSMKMVFSLWMTIIQNNSRL